MQDVVIIGAGGFGREVLDVFNAINRNKNPQYNVMGFIVDETYGHAGTIINEYPILGGLSWFSKHQNVQAICAIGKPHFRYEVIQRVSKLGIEFCTIIHPSVIMTKWTKIGIGTVITAGCVLSNQIELGNHVHINPSSTIGHDAVISDFVSISPGVLISGNVEVGEGTLIGTGTTIIEQKTIGEWSIIGAGSTVIDNIPANTTVVGTPARVIKKFDTNWHLN